MQPRLKLPYHCLIFTCIVLNFEDSMSVPESPVQVFVSVHQPLSYAGSRLRSYPIEASPLETVANFKVRMESVIGATKELMTVIYKNQRRQDHDTLSDTAVFEANAPDNRCHIHVRIEDPIVEARVQAIMAAGLQSLIIPLDKVKIVDK
eukprot:m.246556 g.246556  ORF g.246556 m.246556 type:complete len:149 (+) comp43917_c0_seq1:36-482(+)